MNFPELIKFAMPSIIMMIFLSSYTIVDGFFVTHYVGNDALAALNITYPLFGLMLAIGIMFSTGGSALVGKLLGEREDEKARECFSLISLVSVLIAIILPLLLIIFLKPILSFLGADQETYSYGHDYIVIILAFSPAAAIQLLVQSFLVVDSRPRLGLALTICAGVANMILDYVFMGPCNLGITGAAWATVTGYMISAIGGIIYFLFSRRSLYLVLPKFKISWLNQAMLNGSSEMVTNLSSAIITLLFNMFMLYLIGNKGVSAITVILYAQFVMLSFFLGYSMGVAPVFSYHFGAGNKENIKHIRNKSYTFIAIASVIVFIASMASANITGKLFSNGDLEIKELIVRGTYLFSINYLFAGINVFNSSLFTALNDGKTSAIISFMRTLVFIIVFMFAMTAILKVDGLFLSIPFAELATLLATTLFYNRQYKKLEGIMDGTYKLD